MCIYKSICEYVLNYALMVSGCGCYSFVFNPAGMTLIHCKMGHNRSATVLVCIMACLGVPFDEALGWVRSAGRDPDERTAGEMRTELRSLIAAS